MEVDKIVKFSFNLVVVYFYDAPALTIATNDGTALWQALQYLKTEEYKVAS